MTRDDPESLAARYSALYRDVEADRAADAERRAFLVEMGIAPPESTGPVWPERGAPEEDGQMLRLRYPGLYGDPSTSPEERLRLDVTQPIERAPGELP